MQDTLKFLKTVLPDSGYYCIATPYPKGGYEHTVFETIEEACSYATSVQNKNVYFAVGTLKNDRVWNPDKTRANGEKGAWEYRTHANMSHHKALILDIDCTPDKDYPDQSKCLAAIKAFCDASKFPKPLVVNSGYGLHCYWPFSEEVKSEDWAVLGAKFKAITAHFGLRNDPTAPADMSRVLRVPGTYNLKRDPVMPVKVIVWNQTLLNPARVAKNFDALIESFDIEYHSRKKFEIPEDVLAAFANNPALNKSENNLDKIYELCPQMARCKELGGTVGYAMRSAALSIIKHTRQQDYEPIYNDPNPDIVKEQNDKMLLDTITENPATCERFKGINPEGCAGCVYQGKFKSPILLGREVPQKEVKPDIEPPKASQVEAVIPLDVTAEWKRGVPRFPPPPGFTITDDSVVYNPQSFSDDEPQKPTVILDSKVYLTNVILARDGRTEFVLYIKSGLREPFEVRFDSKKCASVAEMSADLAQYGVLCFQQHQKLVAKYMVAYAQLIQKQLAGTHTHHQLGWQMSKQPKAGCHDDIVKDIFVLPHATFTPEGQGESALKEEFKNNMSYFGSRGSFDEWKSVMNCYNLPGYENYAFAALTAGGSMLMEFTDYSGALISLVGDSGSGKSTVLRVINSFFGRPDEFLTHRDTENAVIKRLAYYGSVCPTIDEVTDLPAERLSNLLFSVSQGRDKLRLGADSSTKENEARWKLVMVSTANRSISGKLADFKSDGGDAESRRLLEYKIDTSGHIMSKSESEEAFRKLNENYGFAGPVLVQYLVANRETVKKEVYAAIKEVDLASNATTVERYWSAVIGCNIAAGRIMNRLGITNFDMERIFEWSIKMMKSLRGVVKDNHKTSEMILSEFLSENVSTMLVMGGGKDKKPFYVISEPRGSLVGRIEVDNKLMYISRPLFRKFITQNGGDHSSVKRDLEKCGMLKSSDAHVVLSKGCDTIKSAQTYAFVLDLSHPSMEGGSFLKEVTKELKTGT